MNTTTPSEPNSARVVYRGELTTNQKISVMVALTITIRELWKLRHTDMASYWRPQIRDLCAAKRELQNNFKLEVVL